MKNLKLYIASKEVDINEDSLVIMNYALEELSNPTIVKNSYSQQIAIPSTPNNDAIFGNIYRLDRSTILSGGYLGASFNPLIRTPFAIYSNLGEIVESGYMKLDNIKREGGRVTYYISLYGGLGSFFYSLSYNEEGDKLTLADLSYIDGTQGELDFNINATNVKNAWFTLKGSGESSIPKALEKWRVINFVPAYNGIPENFDADKAIAKITDAQGRLSAFGMELSKTDGGKLYSTVDGYTLINLGKAHTGEDMKEYRSYLQRPAISVPSMFSAIQDYASSKGFGLQLDPNFFNPDNPYYTKAWMLLPPMTSIEIQSEKKSGTLSGGNGELEGIRDIELTFTKSLENGSATINAKANMSAYGIWTAADKSALAKAGGLRFTRPNGEYNICCAMQLVVVTTDGTQVGSNVVVMMDDKTTAKGERLLSNMGYTPVGNATINECRGYYRYNGTADKFEWTGEAPTFNVSGTNIKSAYLNVTWNQAEATLYVPHYGIGGIIWDDIPLSECFVDFNGTFDFESFAGARTDTLITKQSLLRSEKTPIDYLISYAKTFGLLFSFDKGKNVVTLQARDEWFRRGETIDLTERVDYSQTIEIAPNMIDARYLEFSNKADGAFVKEVEQQSGRPYASTRVDTGSNFNKDTKTAINNNAFNGAAEVCRRSKYNTEITQDGKYVPSVFVDAGVKFTLYNGGEGKEFDVTPPNNTAQIKSLNEGFATYDYDSRIQLHDNEEKPLNMADVLVFYRGTPKYTEKAYQRFRVTDDNDYMAVLNEGKPCWVMDVQGTLDTSLPLPSFGRYIFAEQEDGTKGITHSIDFGIPSQVDIPNVSHAGSYTAVKEGFSADFNSDFYSGYQYEWSGANIYARRWQDFLADQYNVDTRIVRAKVDLRGYQVGESLLRNIYYFENSYWVLNKIVNYSLTSDAPVECEFIKVQDINNYKQSQSF